MTQSANDQIANTATVTVRRSGLYDLAAGNRSETIGALVLEDGTVADRRRHAHRHRPDHQQQRHRPPRSRRSPATSRSAARRATSPSARTSTLRIDAVVANGGINYTGAGLLELNAANTFAGGFTHGGSATVNIANDATFGTGTITTAAAATRTFAVNASARTLANALRPERPGAFHARRAT